MGFINLDLDAIEGYVANHLKLFISMAIGLLAFVGIIAVSIFFIAVSGAEQTMVPDVRGKELTAALLELQVKELYPRISLRYSQSSWDKGQVLEQDPHAGTIVKAGRRSRLVVSQGVLINRVEDYRGRNIDEVRMDIQAIFAEANTTGLPLLSLREPLMYEFSDEDPGTILEQKPEPGAGISGPTTLEFVVSQGPENIIITVPRFAGLALPAALAELGRTGVDFVFTVRPSRGNETGETVVYQEPAAETLAPANAPISLMVNAPTDLPDGEIFDLFTYAMPKNPYPLAVRLEALLPNGERKELINVLYRGGDFTVPYRLPVGSELILSMLNRELHRETISSPDVSNALSLDQL
ncbi:MAG: PASTA domain-containing protein [Treponema sp.]|jgi:beta-lactam-binding protein with PASTA domain|nr:PASTA domain-containing protein [Treponema sp.]